MMACSKDHVRISGWDFFPQRYMDGLTVQVLLNEVVILGEGVLIPIQLCGIAVTPEERICQCRGKLDFLLATYPKVSH